MVFYILLLSILVIFLIRKLIQDNESSSSCGHPQSSMRSHILDNGMETKRCVQLVKKVLPLCAHEQSIPCYMDITTRNCFEQINLKLGCGHFKILDCCDVQYNVDLSKLKCFVPVYTLIKSCGHKTAHHCHLPLNRVKCNFPINKRLPYCGHNQLVPCHHNVKDVECRFEEEKWLICGHYQVKIYCGEDIKDIKCPDKIGQFILSCGHKKLLECDKINVQKDNLLCGEVVKWTKLSCGHQASIFCGETEEDLMDIQCKILVQSRRCSHKKSATFFCFEASGDEASCGKKCKGKLNCGHFCSLPCHDLMFAEKHGPSYYKCLEDCMKKCPKGHTCTGIHECYKKCPVVDGKGCTVHIPEVFSCGHLTLDMSQCSDSIRNKLCPPCTILAGF